MKMLLRIAFTVWGVLLSFGVQAHSKSPAPLPSADSVRTDSTKAHALREATVKTTRLLFITRKDTVIYDLDAVKLKDGANLGDALKKLPGMEIRQKKLYYMGKPVDRLLVNGFDFSRNDPSMALEALPAYIVKSVKAYEQRGELARVTGLDDGSREQVVNVVLRKKYMGTWTGQADLSGGTPDLYSARGYANTFTDRYRVSLFGNANNTNQELWYNGDGSISSFNVYRSGKNAFHSPGGTLFWRNKSDEDAAGYLKIEATGDYNNNTRRNTRYTELETMLSGGSSYNATEEHTHSHETRVAGHLFVTWRPTATTYVFYQNNAWRSRTTSDNNGRGATWNANPFNAGYAPLDSVFAPNLLRAAMFGAVTRTQSVGQGENTLGHVDQLLTVNQKLNSQGANLTWQTDVTHEETASDNFSLDGYHYFRPQANNLPHLLHRYRDNATGITQLGSMLELQWPVGKHFVPGARYAFSHLHNPMDTDGFLLNRLSSAPTTFDATLPLLARLPEGIADWRRLARENEITRHTLQNTTSHSGTLFLRYTADRWFASVDLTLKHENETYDFEKGGFPAQHLTRRQTLPSFSTKTEWKPGSSKFTFDYNLRTSAPSITEQITLPDLADPQNVHLSNPDLKNKVTHSFSLRSENRFEQHRGEETKRHLLYAGIVFTTTANETTQLTAFDRTTGVTTTKPVNISGAWNMSSYLYFPLSLDYANRFVLASYASQSTTRRQNFNVAGSLADARPEELFMHTIAFGFGPQYRGDKLTVESSFGLSYSFTHSPNPIYDHQREFEPRAMVDLEYELPFELHLGLRYRLTHTDYRGTQHYRRTEQELNFDLTRAFLKGKNLTVSLRGHDLFNNNRGITEKFDDAMIQRIYNTVYGRYFLLGFTYRFTTKKQEAEE